MAEFSAGDNPTQTTDPHERLVHDVKMYRALGDTANKTIQFGDATLEVRDYQLEARDALAESEAEGKKSDLLNIATGLGKTTIGIIRILDFMVDVYEREGQMPAVLWAAHQKELLNQAAARFRLLAPTLEQAQLGARRTTAEKPVQFASMQWLVKLPFSATLVLN